MGDSDDMKSLAIREINEALGTQISAVITVYGWTKDKTGALYRAWDILTVKSPLLALDMALGVETVTYTRDENGTLTTLAMVRVGALSTTEKRSRRKRAAFRRGGDAAYAEPQTRAVNYSSVNPGAAAGQSALKIPMSVE